MNRQERRAAAKLARQGKAGKSPDEALRLAIDLQRKQRLEQAERIYRQILKTSPGHAEALHFLGVLRHQKGDSGRAVELIRKAIAQNPEYADAHNNLGNVFKDQDKPGKAVSAYRACLALDPDNANALNNLGAILKDRGEYEEAMNCYRRAIALVPEHADALHNLGNVLSILKRTEEAVAAYLESIALRPGESASYLSLGQLLFKEHRIAEAAGVFRKWLRSDPSNPVAGYLLACCSGQDVPQRASDKYVSQTFDLIAKNFDEALGRLDYRGPEFVSAVIAAEYQEPNASLQVLDAGCGTGLCGPCLRPYADRLTGVDLSLGMLAEARERGIYDELEIVEMTSFMQSHPGAYDLIVSADTLIYFGVLDQFLETACHALKSRGRLIFTVEELIGAEPGELYRLNPNGRYSQSRGYVRQALEHCGLRVKTVDDVILRKGHREEAVQGLVVTAIRE